MAREYRAEQMTQTAIRTRKQIWVKTPQDCIPEDAESVGFEDD